MKYCPRCKKPTKASYNFCIHCGYKLKEPTSPPKPMDEDELDELEEWVLIEDLKNTSKMNKVLRHMQMRAHYSLVF